MPERLVDDVDVFLFSQEDCENLNLKFQNVKLHNKMILGDCCLKETPHSEVTF